MTAWIAVSAQTLGHLLAHKLLSINVESSEAQSISTVMMYSSLFANGLKHSAPAHGRTTKGAAIHATSDERRQVLLRLLEFMQ